MVIREVAKQRQTRQANNLKAKVCQEVPVKLGMQKPNWTDKEPAKVHTTVKSNVMMRMDLTAKVKNPNGSNMMRSRLVRQMQTLRPQVNDNDKISRYATTAS